MADKILRWYIDGNITRSKFEVGGSYTLDADYAPEWVQMHVRVVGNGGSMILDINDDGTSIFTNQPALTEYQTDKKWTTITGTAMRKDSIVTLDIDQVYSQDTARDLTVELGLRKI